LWALPTLYRLITDRDPSFYGTELAYSHFNSIPIANADWLEQLDIYSKYPEISEGLIPLNITPL
jgi:hypothetical protein